MINLTQHWQKLAVAPALAVAISGCANVPDNNRRDAFMANDELRGYLEFTKSYTQDFGHPYVQYPACEQLANEAERDNAGLKGAVAGGGAGALLGSLGGNATTAIGALAGAAAGYLGADQTQGRQFRELDWDCRSRLVSNKVLGGSVVADNVKAKIGGIYTPQ